MCPRSQSWLGAGSVGRCSWLTAPCAQACRAASWEQESLRQRSERAGSEEEGAGKCVPTEALLPDASARVRSPCRTMLSLGQMMSWTIRLLEVTSRFCSLRAPARAPAQAPCIPSDVTQLCSFISQRKPCHSRKGGWDEQGCLGMTWRQATSGLSAPAGMCSRRGPTAHFGEGPQAGSIPDDQKVDAEA